MLTDNEFRWLRRISADSPAATKEQAEKYLQFPKGVLRGVLNNLGLDAEISTQTTTTGNETLKCAYLRTYNIANPFNAEFIQVSLRAY